MDKKQRREFELLDWDDRIIATGVCYSEMNVQVLWRIDTGYGAEQYSNIGYVLNILPEIRSFRWKGGDNNV